ncbi:MAG: sugar ABC transporter ATP-binding protein [Planctomycetota bacterium]|nr:sugar ABC transporter ATP-binding protein [Planctomycetota bacterium]
MKSPTLRLTGISKTFGAVHALRGVNLDLARGEIHAILGENGAGKSTLLRIMAGVEFLDAGSMQLSGQRYFPRSPRDARVAGVCVVHQEPAIAEHRTVADNINLGCEISSFGIVDRTGQLLKARQALEAIGAGMIVDPASPASALTAGTRQLVEIARAFVMRPSVLLLDEPTSSLGRIEADQLWDAVRLLAKSGVAVALVSHRLDEVRRVANRATILRDGAVVESGELAMLDDDALVRAMSGRSSKQQVARKHCTIGKVCFQDGPFQIHAGEIVGVGGLVGSGRSRWLRELALKSGAARVSEDRRSEGFAQSLSIAENLTLPILGRMGRWGIVLASQQTEVTKKWTETLSVKCTSPWQRIGDLSGGNQQKVAIARALEQGTALILVDEPTRGIDVSAKSAIHHILRRTADDGHSIVVVSSDTKELLALCDRIGVMWRGSLGNVKPTSEWTEHSIVDTALRGASAESAA